MKLLEILKDLNPQLLANGQIRSACPFTENHSVASRRSGKVSGDGSKSFFLSPDKNGYHCFSCGAHGTAVRLLTVVLKVPFFEAVEIIKLTDYVSVAKSERSEVFDLDRLWYLEPPQEFLDRGYTEETLEYFKVGKDADGNIVIPLYEGVTLRGLMFRKDSPSGNKIVWHSEGFVKETYLYNYSPKYKEAILVEGPTDLWRVHQFGYNNVVALLGRSASPEQIEMMSKIPVWKFALDADVSGIRAMEKIYRDLEKYVDDISFVDYGEKDPGDVRSIRQWNKALKDSHTYAEFKYLTE